MGNGIRREVENDWRKVAYLQPGISKVFVHAFIHPDYSGHFLVQPAGGEGLVGIDVGLVGYGDDGIVEGWTNIAVVICVTIVDYNVMELCSDDSSTVFGILFVAVLCLLGEIFLTILNEIPLSWDGRTPRQLLG